MSSPPKPLNHSNFFKESNRIVAANNCHFLALAFLFFFPLFCSLISLIPLFRTILVDPQSFHLSNYYYYYTSIYIALFVFSLYVAGVATITYSTQQGLYGKPVNLLSTLKSLSHSFLPLASTTLASTVCLVSVLVAFLLFAASILNGIQILGLEIIITPNSKDLMMGGICIFALGILLLCCCHVNLILAAVIAVTESKWGFEPLRQSFYLVKGMKGSSLSILLLRGISTNFVLPLGLSTSIFLTASPSRWDYLQIMNISLFATMFMSPFVTTYTVLYLYCKDLHEESGFDIARAEEISKDCVSLAMDDDNLASQSNVMILVCCATLMLVFVTMQVFALHIYNVSPFLK